MGSALHARPQQSCAYGKNVLSGAYNEGGFYIDDVHRAHQQNDMDVLWQFWYSRVLMLNPVSQ